MQRTAAIAPRSTDNDFARHFIRYGMGFAPFVIQSARGVVMRDVDGREILDFTSGQMCATLGHNHPAVIRAIEKACDEALHLFSGILSVPVVSLAEELAALLPSSLQKMIFLSTGAETNESALRMAKLYTGRFEVIGLDGSWHGMTGGTVSSTYAAGRVGYGPAMPGTMALPMPNCYRCPLRQRPDDCGLACLDVGFAMVDAQSVGSLAAVIAEPVLSSGGVIVPPAGYFQRLKKECERRGMLFIFDEAQTAFGRLGANFGFELFGVVPDILTLSKTLGGGLPLGATVTSDEIEQVCADRGYLHATSHVSDPLPAEVGRAVLRVLVEEEINARAIKMGDYLKAGLRELQARHEAIGDVRGMGLLLGVEIVKDRETREADPERGARVTRRCMELGLSMNIVAHGIRSAVWRIAPAPIIEESEIDRGLAIIDQALNEVS
ncbi:MAG: aspartate aminotransferase family protein [Hyphomicrobiales bacterium]|nr:aspartate aminotransferase family protein [Hyphomicrobiales bacterium]